MDARRTEPSVVESPRPSFSDAEAAEIARRAFGVSGTIIGLSSERDQAFLVDDGANGGGILKISNVAERPEVIDMEAAAILHVLRIDPGIPLARPIARARPGDGLEVYRDEAPGPAGMHLVRMSERLPGRGSVPGATLDARALRAFGALVARLGRALRGFTHPQAGRELLWDLQHVLRLRPWVGEIERRDRRALVTRALDRFEERVAPRWAELRAQVIHGDVTLDNALLDEANTARGIVDFGDMSHTALVVDVSSALESVLRGRDADGALRAARSLMDGYEGVTPLEPLELELVADLTAARTAMTLTITTRQVAADPSRADYIDATAEEYWGLLEVLDGIDPDEAAAALGAEVPADAASLVARRSGILGSALTAPTYDPPLYLVRGEGTWLYDDAGRAYLDAYNNVPVLGHAHPRVTGAVARQSRRLATNMRYLHHAVVELAERLVATLPAGSGLDTVLFVNSGSEANDVAWRIARAWTGRAGAIVTEHAYHGITDAIAALSPEEWRGGDPPPHVGTILPPDPRRIELGSWATQIEGAAASLADRTVEAAAVMIDAAFTSDGVFRPDASAMADLVARTHAVGALYVADEVQVGHGRSGEALWSFVADGVAPDLVTLGKPMGNGFPIAAVITRAELVDRFGGTTEFFSTFGGSPPAAAAALAVLDVIEDEDLVARAEEVGRALEADLRGIGSPSIEQVRRRGLTIGVELGGPEPAALVAEVMNRTRDRGVLIGATGRRGEVLKIRPPLSITLDEADATTVQAPRARHLPVDQEGVDRVRGLRVEHARAEALGQDLRAARVHQQRGVPRPQEADGRRRVGVRERCPGHVEQLPALLVTEPAQPEALEGGSELRHRQPGEARDVGACSRPERAQVATHEVLDRRAVIDLRRPDPVLRGRVQIGAAALPRPRGRDAHQIEPQADPVPDPGLEPQPLVDLGARPGTVGQQPPHAPRSRGDRARVLGVPGRFQPPRAPWFPHRLGEEPVVRARDDVDRRAHQGALDHAATFQRAGQVLPAEPVEPRPQAHVRRRRVLGLQASHALHRAGERRAHAVQQQLTGEERPVELALGERPLGYGAASISLVPCIGLFSPGRPGQDSQGRAPRSAEPPGG